MTNPSIPDPTTAPAGAAVPADELHLERIEVRLVRVPLRRPLATKIAFFEHWPLVLIDVLTREGITGSAYLAPYVDQSAVLIARALRDLPAAMARAPLGPQERSGLQRWLSVAGQQGLGLCAAAGLDMACLNAPAKQANLTLARLLGGSNDPVAAYSSNGLGLIDPGLVADEASRRCHEVDDLGLCWIEEPLRYDDLAGHAGLARECATPIMLGENFLWSSGHVRCHAIRAHLYPEVSAQVMGVTPSRKWLVRQDWAHPVLAEPFRIEGGLLHIPESAGNGISWDEEAVRHYATDA